MQGGILPKLFTFLINYTDMKFFFKHFIIKLIHNSLLHSESKNGKYSYIYLRNVTKIFLRTIL